MEDKNWVVHPSVLEELERRMHQPHPASTGTTTDRVQREVDNLNASPGSLTGIDCPKCKNKGLIYERDGDYVVSHECDCMSARREQWRIEKSGLGDSLKVCTFEAFQTPNAWQKSLKESALRFLEDKTGAWFFAGGQPGAGKTHICTAIVGALLKRGMAARYMLWKDEATYLKAHINDDVYETRVSELKTVPVLYIDDFFRTPYAEDGTRKKPTPGDINLAFEILNARYVNRLTTLLTSERTIDDLLDCDEAIGSRIYERCKGYTHNLAPDRRKNWRLAT